MTQQSSSVVGHRLRAAREVDDGQPAVTEAACPAA